MPATPGPVEHLRLIEQPRPCSYLPAQTASLEYRLITDLGAEDYRRLLTRGWRRHGMQVFRPACPACFECRSLRVDTLRFAPSNSQRRCLKRNSDVQVVTRPPSVSEEHIRLYNAWHADMALRKGWPHARTNAADYARGFLAGRADFAREMLYLRNGSLIGVGLVDLISDGLSSVYFFHDPDWRPLGPGVFSALHEIEYCRSTGRRWWYAGYWIAACPSMAYKADYVPHQLLARHVADDEEPLWEEPNPPTG